MITNNQTKAYTIIYIFYYAPSKTMLVSFWSSELASPHQPVSAWSPAQGFIIVSKRLLPALLEAKSLMMSSNGSCFMLIITNLLKPSWPMNELREIIMSLCTFEHSCFTSIHKGTLCWVTQSALERERYIIKIINEKRCFGALGGTWSHQGPYTIGKGMTSIT